jgi:hypothetical protein
VTFYVRTPLSPEGIFKLSGSMEKVDDRGSATELVRAEADFLQERAQQGWPDFNWQLEDIGSGKYIVKAEELRMRHRKTKSVGSV